MLLIKRKGRCPASISESLDDASTIRGKEFLGMKGGRALGDRNRATVSPQGSVSLDYQSDSLTRYRWLQSLLWRGLLWEHLHDDNSGGTGSVQVVMTWSPPPRCQKCSNSLPLDENCPTEAAPGLIPSGARVSSTTEAPELWRYHLGEVQTQDFNP